MSRYDLESEKSLLDGALKKDAIKWPKMSDGNAWQQFENNVAKQLNWNARAEQQLTRLENVVYEEGKSCFGVVEKSVARKTGPPRRERKIATLRREIKGLSKKVAEASDREIEADIWLYEMT
jgi:hypothetical protein